MRGINDDRDGERYRQIRERKMEDGGRGVLRDVGKQKERRGGKEWKGERGSDCHGN